MQLTKEQVDLFLNLETSLHKKEIRNSVEAVSELLSDDFLEFGNSGIKYNKNLIIKELESEQEDLNVKVEDFTVSYISADIVLVTYKSVRFVDDLEKKVEAMRSSLWKLFGEKWKMIFHQGSRIL